MLPSELLVAKVRGGMIRPVYLSITGETVRLAEELISVYSRDIGKKRGEILKSTRELEGRVEDFRVVRGLCTLIERRAVFETRSPIDPSSIREAVFEAGVPVLDEGLRSRVLVGAAKKLGISPDDVQRYMWSDLMDEKVLA
ncbi:MAG: DUF790 family protein, partial [Candidatus Verstraetearchaeota archaeon]|nr:DUF790 family protein [Candidatus Verstraetearchaeota archaeon]